ncbi:MAG: dCTP deaminase [SAR202 cluster bacterium Io17-Chloro-G6]|nr:MAG: dCTP deaminase [SAR202 cluster bacterium Io17-Chloro-G6]
MILSDREIWMELQTGRMIIDPQVEFNQVAPSSVDLRLGNHFTKLSPINTPGVITHIDVANADPEQIASLYGIFSTISDHEAFTLEPHDFVLAFTKERVTLPNYLGARIEGKSSLARFGISIHQTAPTVHATFGGVLRLEISNGGPYTCLLRPGQNICQLIIERLGTPSQSSLISNFQGQTPPIA